MGTPISRRVLQTAYTLRRTLAAGVTFVRDAGIADADVRDAVAAGLVPGPELQVSVVALGTTGGHVYISDDNQRVLQLKSGEVQVISAGAADPGKRPEGGLLGGA